MIFDDNKKMVSELIEETERKIDKELSPSTLLFLKTLSEIFDTEEI